LTFPARSHHVHLLISRPRSGRLPDHLLALSHRGTHESGIRDSPWAGAYANSPGPSQTVARPCVVASLARRLDISIRSFVKSLRNSTFPRQLFQERRKKGWIFLFFGAPGSLPASSVYTLFVERSPRQEIINRSSGLGANGIDTFSCIYNPTTFGQ
jgi:hypothetical protein